jgi:Zn-dependent protease
VDIQGIVVAVLPILIAITFHEVSHGYVANKLGDPTAKFTGRLTLNPIAHIDPIGTLLMPIILFYLSQGQFVFGYAKPVPINPMNFRDPRKHMALSAAAGPITNIALSIVSQIVLMHVIIPASAILPHSMSVAVLKPLALMFKFSVIINIVLAVINLIPIPPLDGGRVLIGFLPHRQAVSYSKIEPYGFIIVIVLFITGIAHIVIYPLVALLYTLIRLF